MQDTTRPGQPRGPRGRFVRARISRQPQGWYVEPIGGDAALFDTLWGAPWAQTPEAERYVCPEMAETAFKQYLADIAKGFELRLTWRSLVEFEARPMRRRKARPPAYVAGQVNNLVEPGEQVYADAQSWRDLTETEVARYIERYVYKFTDCGAWFTVLREDKVARGVQVGSIVEGIEPTTETYTLMFPFEAERFTAALDAVEAEAAALWNDTHGCPECWDGAKNAEGWPVDEEGDELVEWPVKEACKACGGHGRII